MLISYQLYTLIMSSLLLHSLFIPGFPSTLFSFRTTLFSFWIDNFRVLRTFKLIESSPKPNLVQSYITLVPQTIMYSITNEMPIYIYLECIISHEVMIERSQVTQSIYVCIIYQESHKYHQWNTDNILCVLVKFIYHEQYNMIHLCRHENVFLNTCLLHLYFYPYEVCLNLGISYSSVIHIYSVAGHDVVRDKYTLFPQLYLQKYNE